MTISVIIVAAGRGTRAGQSIPKQFVPVAGVPVLLRSIQAFLDHPLITNILPVLHTDDFSLYYEITQNLSHEKLLPPVAGGITRAHSSLNGLRALSEYNPEKVMIHDAARPFVSKIIIDQLIAALETHAGALPALPVSDALWTHNNGKTLDTPIDRSKLVRVQTPQAFRYKKICEAFEKIDENALDDASIARNAGLDVALIDGHENNFKITHADDFKRAEMMMRAI